jgi:hypothetical protein
MSVLRSVTAILRGLAFGLALLVILAVVAALYVSSPSHSPIQPGAAATPPSASSAPVSATVELSGAEPAEPPVGECLRHVKVVDAAPSTIEGMTSISTGVFIGRISEVGPTRWRTTGEKTPSEQQEISVDNVMRLVRVAVEEVAAGAADGTMVFWIPGGTIGCHTFETAGFPLDLKTGDEFGFFIDANQAPLKGVTAARVHEMWPVQGDTVVTPEQGDISIAEFAAEAEAAEVLSP